jgi:hypothetical protein
MSRSVAYTIGALLVAAASGPALAATNACKATAAAALKACRAESRADNATAQGKCVNSADRATVKACKQEAASDAKDFLAECKDEDGARKDLCERLGPAPYVPAIDLANFTNSTTIDNEFFPLVPGTTFVYEGQTAGGLEHDEFAVTHATRAILGVTCIEVHDTATVNGVLTEDTRDWFAQDNAGNVWYFGENTAVLENGLPVDLAGSWTAGVDGARPGITMEAQPMLGDIYRQEFLLGEAEDVAEVISLTATEAVPFPPGTFSNVLETEETSPLAPGDVEHKFYASGVGNILTIDVATGERSELIEIETGQ